MERVAHTDLELGGTLDQLCYRADVFAMAVHAARVLWVFLNQVAPEMQLRSHSRRSIPCARDHSIFLRVCLTRENIRLELLLHFTSTDTRKLKSNSCDLKRTFFRECPRLRVGLMHKSCSLVLCSVWYSIPMIYGAVTQVG